MFELEDTISKIQNDYTVNGLIYLSQFYQENGNHWLYTTLQSLYKPVYEPNERIVVVQDCPEVYDYTGLPGKAITQLQKYASQIDISNFFIILITGNANIEHELTQARELYSTDSVDIQHIVVDDLNFQFLENKKYNTFCSLPWMHLYVGTNGDILPCCVGDQNLPMGNINNQNISDIINSEQFVNLRKNMLSGQRSKECEFCYVREDAGLPSLRVGHNHRWPVKNPTEIISNFTPLYLDIRLNNICNLKCRMCSGYFSSAIATEEIELYGNSKLPKALKNQQRQNALSKIIHYVPFAKKIYFAGGEPLLAKEHYTILEELVKHKNTNLEIVYNTNFTTLHYQDFYVLDLWKQFSNITIQASLDAEAEVAEYVRHGSKWNDIEKNLELLKTQCPHVYFIVTSAVGFLTVKSLIDLQQRWHNNKVLDIKKFSLTVITSPEHITVQVLPQHHKQRLEHIITQHINWCNQQSAKNLALQWENVLKYMWAEDSTYQLFEFKRLTNLLDQHRGESFIKTFPEFKDLL